MEGVSEADRSAVVASGLSTKTCYPKLISAMKSHNWYIQNPAIDRVMSNGCCQADELTDEQQVNLGRNILQSGEGTAGSSIEFLEKLTHDAANWPFGVIRGIALESFTNEKNEIRLKNGQLDLVLTALVQLKDIQRDGLIAEIVESVDAGTPKRRVHPDDYHDVLDLLSEYEWAAPLVKALKTKLSEETVSAR